MESGRTQSSSVTVREAEDPGEEPDEGENNRATNDVADSGSNNLVNSNNTSNSSPLPPSYPCHEVCSRCSKKITDTINDEAGQEPQETLVDCPCECHVQSQKLSLPQMHIPPRGPNCLPGCGYSGLPCYVCSSSENNPQTPEPPAAQPVSQGLTQIYTVELMNPGPINGFQSQGMTSAEHMMLMQSEEHNEARKRRRTCISLVVFIITINVAIAIFRMLSTNSLFY